MSGNAAMLKDMARRGGFNDISYLFIADTHRDGHDFHQAVGIVGGDEYFSLVYEDNTGRQRLFYPDYILSIGGEVWILEVKGSFNASGGSQNIDIYAPMKSSALMAYCARHGVRGGFVCYDEGEDELLINEGRFSEDRNDPNWRTVEDTLKVLPTGI